MLKEENHFVLDQVGWKSKRGLAARRRWKG